ncbi:carbon monoxide dehydrogenase/acetyl-CoA synthase subunit beta [Thermacetogenium phaeum DSM 12270]|uniref:Carbon monoxide dehydrogenase n=1 Tax=Thermacetogenium phaeum (strain ATCC BAA-254 / DSM 26808 / PB) TaxID=1089553 RepID=K4LID0_THEPS|nr:anaerobic carbon-monoxide dehydrogenase catalytic subunit [Thermacetogenium phaeum]AFV11725.1 carbon monoxide dehydrogenase/acetyl-CoA synthase subunit beta [Thermacetogenium phaeum DSM 12270]
MPRFRDTSLQNSKPSVDRKNRIKEPKNIMRTVDPAALEILEYTKENNIITAFDRWSAQQPQCAFGYQGICCRICFAGPCRIKGVEGPGSMGICGARDYTIVARNAIRMMAGGCSAHSDHGRELVEVLYHLAEGHAPDYEVRDPDKLRRVAKKIGLEIEGKSDLDLAKEVAEVAFEDYGRHTSEGCKFLKANICEKRIKKYEETDTMPRAIDREVVEVMHRTHVGVDADPVNLIFGGIKCSLADVTGEHISTDISDILFGTPKPVMSEANLGVIDPDKVNIIVHGHNPVLSQMVVDTARELEEEAKAAGAKGIGISGICCTGNEVLMRNGVPIATSYMAQELAIATGAIDVMVVDVQCIMPGLRNVCECFNTKLVTTMSISKIPGSYHFSFEDSKAKKSAEAIIRLAIEAYKDRKNTGRPVRIPQFKNKLMAGFSLEALLDLFAAINPDNPIKVLTDAIINGEIAGVCALAGCNNLEAVYEKNHTEIVKELAKNNVFMVGTGCVMQAAAKHGLLNYEAVEKYAGPGLKRFIDRLYEANKDKLSDKLPLAFHMGSCVDNSRILDLWTEMANALNVDVPKVPFVATAPEGMSEKAVAIGTWVVASGIPCHVGAMPPLEGSNLVWSVVTCIAHDVFGGYFILETDPQEAAKKLLAALEYRAWKLKVHMKAAEEYGTELCQAF